LGPARPAAVDWLIVGLGNPGREHEGTRHNVGFVVADELARRWELPKPKHRFRGRIAEGRADGAPGAWMPGEPSQSAPRVAMLWPLTYMNEAGRSAGPACGSYRLPIERVLVLHDEIDLPFGEVRVRQGGGLAGHNGLKSLSRELGGPGFWRVRVGVGRPDSSDPEIVASYVLSRFREGEAEVGALVQRASDAAEAVVLGGPQS
jgi:PTH1 family peptidyl-tRNA hydrolase